MSLEFNEEMLDNLINELISSGKFVESKLEPFAFEDFEKELKLIYSKYFDEAFLSERLSIPEDYRLFLQKEIQLVNGDYWICFLDGRAVLNQTKYFLEVFEDDFFERKEATTPFTSDTIWIHVGFWSDKHHLMMCCEKGHALYGKVFDMHDDHPWMSENYYLETEYNSFLDMLNDYLPKEEDY